MGSYKFERNRTWKTRSKNLEVNYQRYLQGKTSWCLDAILIVQVPVLVNDLQNQGLWTGFRSLKNLIHKFHHQSMVEALTIRFRDWLRSGFVGMQQVQLNVCMSSLQIILQPSCQVLCNMVGVQSKMQQNCPKMSEHCGRKEDRFGTCWNHPSSWILHQWGQCK